MRGNSGDANTARNRSGRSAGSAAGVGPAAGAAGAADAVPVYTGKGARPLHGVARTSGTRLPWDRASVMRRARRVADLSQRQMADRIGVSPATVARAECGDGGVSLAVVEAVLAEAGLRIVVIDDDRIPVEPMNPGAARDNAGRRYPAHLDAWIPTRRDEPFTGWREDRARPRLVYHLRCRRDERRNRLGVVPRDHSSELERTLARHLRRRRPPAWVQEMYRRQPPLQECCCGPECELYCVPDCACQCEPPGCDLPGSGLGDADPYR